MSSTVETLRIVAGLINRGTGELVGFRVVGDIGHEVKTISATAFLQNVRLFQSLFSHVQVGGISKLTKSAVKSKFDVWHIDGIGLKFLDGSNKKMPLVDSKTMQVIANDVVIGRARVVDNDGKTVAFLVTDYTGMTQVLDVNQVISYKDVGYFNLKVGMVNGQPSVQTVRGKLPILNAVDVFNNKNYSIKSKWG